MKRRFTVWLGLCLVLGSSFATVVANEKTPVASRGETLVVALGRHEVRVAIATHEVDIGKPTDARPEEIGSSCTYSRFPCSVVDAIKITIDGRALFVPRSVYCSLADVAFAQLDADRQEWTLTLTGGDASEGYIVRVTLDADRVKKKALWGALSPDALLEETVYHLQVLGD